MEAGLYNIISGAIGAIAGLAGGFTSNWYQFKLKSGKETIEKKYQVFNKILEAHGEAVVIKTVNRGGNFRHHIDLQEYFEKVRPHFFSGFNLLDKSMREKINTIDSRKRQMEIVGGR